MSNNCAAKEYINIPTSTSFSLFRSIICSGDYPNNNSSPPTLFVQSEIILGPT